MTGWLAALGALLGLMAGSFLNVVIHRVPEGRSVITPRSACPSCAAPIRPRDNIPILSWLLLRGRCRACGAAISLRYPLVEAGTAGVFAGLAFLVSPSWTLPAYWIGGATAFALALVDLERRRIPNAILFPGLAVSWVLLIAGALGDGDPGALLRTAGGAGGYFALLLLVAIAARGGFGLGDVKYALLLGTFLAHRSWEALVVGVFAAFAVGGLLGAGLLLARRVGRKDVMAFGPAMLLGAVVGLVWGVAISEWYLGR